MDSIRIDVDLVFARLLLQACLKLFDIVDWYTDPSQISFWHETQRSGSHSILVTYSDCDGLVDSLEVFRYL